MMLATSALWLVPGGSPLVPATVRSSLHGLLIAPQRVQPSSICWVGLGRLLAGSSRAAGALGLAAAALSTVAVGAAAGPFATVAAEPFAAAAAEPCAAAAAAAAGPRRLDPKWLSSDGRRSRASSGLVGALEPPKRSGNGT